MVGHSRASQAICAGEIVPDDMRLEVHNEREVLRALDRVAKEAQDLSDVNDQVGNLLLPDIRRNTRRKTGLLAESWEASGEPAQAAFSNPQKYAVVQEFGGSQIEPTNAVARAFEENKDAVIDQYGAGIAKRAERTGFRTKGG